MKSMGTWSFGLDFWIKFWVTLPIRLLLFSPYWVIMPFSEERAINYSLKNKPLNVIDEWIEKKGF